jgi:hypothetical protein
MTAEELIMERNLIEMEILFEFVVFTEGIVEGQMATEGYHMWAKKKVLLPFVPRVGDSISVGYSFHRTNSVRDVLVNLAIPDERIVVYLEPMEPSDRFDWLKRLGAEGWTITFQ